MHTCVYLCKQSTVAVVVRLCFFFPCLMLWTYFYDFQTNVKTSKPFCCPCVGDEVLHHRDKHASRGTSYRKENVHGSCF